MNLSRLFSFRGGRGSRGTGGGSAKEPQSRSARESPGVASLPFSRRLADGDDPPLDESVRDVLDRLDDYLPPPVGGAPPSTISLVTAEEESLGVGNRRGVEDLGAFGIVQLKGLHLNALVRFQLWANDAPSTETAANDLNIALLTDRDALFDEGFLKIRLEATAPVERDAGLGAWRKHADYRVLYEFRYEDADEAESIISRIPIHSDPERAGSPDREITVVVDEMARWDDAGAPFLELRGGRGALREVGAVAILAFLPIGWDGRQVTVTTSSRGAVQHFVFESARAFLNQFTLQARTVQLGGNPYVAGRLEFPNLDFPNPVTLDDESDFFRIEYAVDAFDSAAVVYLRALS